MRLLRRTLTHISLQSPFTKVIGPTPLPVRCRTVHLLRCRCMSSVKRFAPRAAGAKRQKLAEPPCLQQRLMTNMAPGLIQEISSETSESGRQNDSIELNETEETLRRLLLDVAKYVETNPDSKGSSSQVKLPDELVSEAIVLRFTGGWVRDKLLGVKSHDIDVAINKMTGEQFGLRLKEYLEIPGNPEKYGLEGVATTDKQNQKAITSDKSKIVGGLHKIEANPEKSKHLETIATTILGLDIDLVNLRKETYTEDSRNPQIEFGTPEEDAMRRDATVNAMFYNLSTREIEDFTGLGREDLRRGIIRTPLEPYQTFKDDPLRVLRLIRFASRLDYKIEATALEAMRNPDITVALRRKISRERVGVELEKALRGPDPHEALRLIFDLDLYYTTFSDPTVEEDKHYTPDLSNWKIYLDSLEDMIRNNEPLAALSMRDGEERFLAWQLASLVPYRDAPQPESTAPGRRPPPPVATSVAREGIKSPNRVCDVVTWSLRNQEEISSLVDRLSRSKRIGARSNDGTERITRDVLGMAIRRWGSTWRSQVVYSCLVEIADQASPSEDAVLLVERKYNEFLKHLEELDLLEACSLKPLLDGKSLAKALDTPPGPWMTDALNVVMAWQLRNPDVTNPQEAIEEVRRRRGELSHTLAQHFLTLTIRPLFLKSKPDTITNHGRKVLTPSLPTKITVASLDDTANKPWKAEKEQCVLELLSWSTSTLDASNLERFWPLVIPPVLALIDDWEIDYKIRGVESLNSILAVASSPLLRRTGLDDVIDQALLPCLTYLPSLTPEADSIRLLENVYRALLQLYQVRYPDAHPSPETARPRVKALDNLMRKGVFYTYDNCSSRPHMISISFQSMCRIVECLGIDSVKHLRGLVTMLTETLMRRVLATDAEQHSTLIITAKAYRAVIQNAWPRISEYRGEILKGLARCWISLEGHEATVLRHELKETVRLLRVVIDDCLAKDQFRGECQGLVAADDRIADLLK